MTDQRSKILLVEDSTSLARVYAEYLSREGYEVTAVETAAEALAALADGDPRVVLLDLGLPDMNGMEVLRRARADGSPAAIIIITAHGSVNAAVEAMRAGAYDFLVKPFTPERMLVTVANAAERLRLSQIVDTYRREMGRERYHGFIGSSLAIQSVYRIIDSAAPSKATVFITGESGTGKEVCADAIHRQSPRRDGPLVAINCGAIPKDLLESEIFGHVRGSFTGAVTDREGAAARANGGTLFLDEICELELNLQTKLLRFVQTGTFTPVGGARVEKVDLRIVCATNRDPLREVEEGRFREDLFYRLHVVPMHLPPLREREDDVLEIGLALLAEYAREEGKAFKRFDAECESALRAYHWPGNVRQLQNVIRNIVVLREGETVTVDMLPPPLGAVSSASTPVRSRSVAAGPEAVRPLWRTEKEAIESAIDACGGNIPRAAALLEVSPSTIYRKRLAWEAEGKL